MSATPSKGVKGRERARARQRRKFRRELLALAGAGKRHAAVTLALCLGHEDLIPQLQEIR
jgi:endonuclease III